MVELRLDEVDAATILALRTRILRPDWPADRLCHYAEDALPTTHHVALLDRAGQPAAAVSFIARPAPFAPDVPAVQMRGMAVDAPLQGQGLGRRLLDGALARLPLLYADIDTLWCNARVHVVDFYRQAGFEVVGEPFELPEIGAHVVMRRPLPTLLADRTGELG